MHCGLGLKKSEKMNQVPGFIFLLFPAVAAMPSTMSCFYNCDPPVLMNCCLGKSARINDSFLKFLLSEYFITVTSELLSNQI